MSPEWQQGDRVRREVLGDEHVDAARPSEFSAPLQQLVTEYCWGTLWTREGLPRQTRSLLNLAMLAVLNRPHELRAHTRGALKNGCSEQEIAEVLLQVCIYAGVPAAVDAFRTVETAINEFRSKEEAEPAASQPAGRGSSNQA